MPTAGDTVIDAYCGIGTFSLPLAAKAGKVIGIEQNPAAVRDARRNAAANEINNVEFISGDVEKVLTHIAPSLEDIDLLVVDPPRKGLTPAILQSIVKLSPVVWSTSPATPEPLPETCPAWSLTATGLKKCSRSICFHIQRMLSVSH